MADLAGGVAGVAGLQVLRGGGEGEREGELSRLLFSSFTFTLELSGA